MSGTSRIARIPLDHVLVELVAYPLASETAFELGLTELNPKLKTGTDVLWRCAEKELLGNFPAFSVDEVVTIRDMIWFRKDKSSSTGFPYFLRSFAHGCLQIQSSTATPKLPESLISGNTNNANRSVRARTLWWWLSVALPPDLLLAALHDQGTPSRVETLSPKLSRHLNDHGFAETHLHLGAGLDFRVLWISALLNIADYRTKRDAFKSPGAAFNEGRLIASWLLRAAIVRYFLADFLCSPGYSEDLTAYFTHYINLNPTIRVLLSNMLGELYHGQLKHSNDTDYPALQMFYRRLALPRMPTSLNQVAHCDPIAHLFPPPNRYLGSSSDMLFCHEAIKFLERKGSNDQLFAKLFWQTIRVQSLLYRHLVQRPLTPGLQWFVRFFGRLSPAKKPLPTRVFVEASAHLCGFGKGLRSLEVRAGTMANYTNLLQLVRDIDGVSRQLRSPDPSQGTRELIEIGLVFHFCKDRGGNAREGLPIAHGKDSNADPAFFQNGSCRYAYFFKKKLEPESIALRWLIRNFPQHLDIIRGIDVCTDELGVPNWVLSPLFIDIHNTAKTMAASRSITSAREIEPLRTTVHAGEDFVHLLTGLRNMDEAIECYQLSEGDRIGHGVALGVDPRQWASSAGRLAITVEDRLFDLLWYWSWLGHSGYVHRHGQKHSLEHEIQDLIQDMFSCLDHQTYSIHDIHTLREDLCNPLRLHQVGYPTPLNWRCTNKRLSLLYEYLTNHKLFELGRKLMWIDPAASGDLLTHLQSHLRRKIGQLGITVEVNPSSNLLIGDLSSLQTHPLWRMHPPIPLDDVPPVSICIGSDDPAVFASNLRQEYQRVLDALMLAGLSEEQAMVWLDRARTAGLDTRFTLT